MHEVLRREMQSIRAVAESGMSRSCCSSRRCRSVRGLVNITLARTAFLAGMTRTSSSAFCSSMVCDQQNHISTDHSERVPTLFAVNNTIHVCEPC